METTGWMRGAAAAAGLLLASGLALAQEKKATPAPASKAAVSSCKGLDQGACGANADCQWIAPKSGKQHPYCRLKPKGKKATAPKGAPANK